MILPSAFSRHRNYSSMQIKKMMFEAAVFKGGNVETCVIESIPAILQSNKAKNNRAVKRV